MHFEYLIFLLRVGYDAVLTLCGGRERHIKYGEALGNLPCELIGLGFRFKQLKK